MDRAVQPDKEVSGSKGEHCASKHSLYNKSLQAFKCLLHYVSQNSSVSRKFTVP